MSNKVNDTLMDLAIEMVDERIAKNPGIPSEARQQLINEVYEELSK